MKTELSHYSRQLAQVYDGRPWYGDSLLQKLEQIGPKEAFATPVPGAHSIAQIVAHMITWRTVLTGRLSLKNEYHNTVTVGDEQDWPSTAALQAKGWQKLLKELADNQVELLRLLGSTDEALLDETYAEAATYRSLIERVIQHDVCHIGQIGLLMTFMKIKKP